MLLMNGRIVSVADKKNEKGEVTVRTIQVFYEGPGDGEKAQLYEVVDFGGNVKSKRGEVVSLPVYAKASQGANGKVYLNYVVESSHLEAEKPGAGADKTKGQLK